MACAADLERSGRSMACAADLARSMACAADLARSMACAADLARSKASAVSFRPSTLPGTTAWRPCLPYFQPPTPPGTDATTAPDSRLPASFQTPTQPDTDATTTGRRSCLPAWVFLDKKGHIDKSQNASKAKSCTSGGKEVIVSFFPAEPPGLSHFSIHCPGLRTEDFARQPFIVHSEDNLVLLSLSLKGAPQTDYCIYRAGCNPSLKFVKGLGSYIKAMKLSIHTMGFVTLGDGEHFVLAALKYRLTDGQYEVHVFRSKLETWTCNVLLEAELHAHGMVLEPQKVITLGSGKIGWVDLWKGILVCNVVNENPVLSFIPLPSLLPANRVEFSQCDARSFRDVVCLDGMIRCIEREVCRRRIVREMPDVSNTEVLHDSELWWDPKDDTKEDYEDLGWRIITWDRPISSNCWHKGFLVHVDEILVNNSPSHSVTLAEIGHKSPQNLTLKELVTCFPTLSMVNSDVVYLVCKGVLEDQKSWVVAINLEKKTVEELVPFSSGGSYFSGMNYIPCALSKYLNTDSDERLKEPGFKLMKPHTADTGCIHSLQASGKQANKRKEKETLPGMLTPSTAGDTRGEARINAGGTISRALDDGTLIGGQNTSWGSYTSQTPQENVNNWTTVFSLNHYAPNYGSYCSQVPNLYANGMYPWYGNYHHKPQPQPLQPQLQPPPLSVVMR
ncbi:uncharacterized protein LOC124703830 isoform X2 [Lolium rigidum]|nr:uncharacterized protein LOC124703830 isoform X2 [Lolium rigidum]